MDKKPIVIAINAVSGGGKTAVTNELCRKLQNSRAIHFDSYKTHDSHNWELMTKDVKNIMDQPQNTKYIILDYPLDDKHRKIAEFDIDLSVYIDTPLDIALARRIIRDISPQTQVDDITVLLTGYLRARSTYYPPVSSQASDFKIDGSLPIEKIADIIVEKIHEKF